MTEPKNSIVKQYEKLFKLDDVELVFEQEALEQIADITLERKTGARGLRSVFEKILTPLMFTVPSDFLIEKIVVTKNSVLENEEPKIIKNLDRIPKDIKVSDLTG